MTWRENPSVRPGGKPVFWTKGGYPDPLWTVVWDRWVQHWAVTKDHVVLCYCKNPADGKALVDGGSL